MVLFYFIYAMYINCLFMKLIRISRLSVITFTWAQLLLLSMNCLIKIDTGLGINLSVNNNLPHNQKQDTKGRFSLYRGVHIWDCCTKCRPPVAINGLTLHTLYKRLYFTMLMTLDNLTGHSRNYTRTGNVNVWTKLGFVYFRAVVIFGQWKMEMYWKKISFKILHS